MMIITTASGLGLLNMQGDSQYKQLLSNDNSVKLAIIFGSIAMGKETPESDLDIAILEEKPMSIRRKYRLIEKLTFKTGRSIDLIDLYTVGEPLLGQILKYGQRIKNNDQLYAQLLTKHVIDEADFMPYQRRILKIRRNKWLNN